MLLTELSVTAGGKDSGEPEVEGGVFITILYQAVEKLSALRLLC